MPIKKSSTIKEIAKKSGVSVATVSRVINNATTVKHVTAEKVRNAIIENNYKPLLYQRNSHVNDGRKLNIGIYSESFFLDALVNPLMMFLSKNNCNFSFYDYRENVDPAPMLKEKIDGLVVIDKMDNLMKFNALLSIPIVRVLGSNDEKFYKYDHFSYNARLVGELAAKYLIKQGCEEFYYLSYYADVSIDRYAGFAETLKKNNIEAKCFEYQWLEDSVRHYPDISQFKRGVSGIFALDDHEALLIYNYFTKHGWQYLEDYILVSCNNERDKIGHISDNYASVDIHIKDLALQVARQLLWRVENPTTPRVLTLLDPVLSIRTIKKKGKDLNYNSNSSHHRNY